MIRRSVASASASGSTFHRSYDKKNKDTHAITSASASASASSPTNNSNGLVHRGQQQSVPLHLLPDGSNNNGNISPHGKSAQPLMMMQQQPLRRKKKMAAAATAAGSPATSAGTPVLILVLMFLLASLWLVLSLVVLQHTSPPPSTSSSSATLLDPATGGRLRPGIGRLGGAGVGVVVSAPNSGHGGILPQALSAFRYAGRGRQQQQQQQPPKEQHEQQHAQLVNKGVGAAAAINGAADLVDMRQLTYELPFDNPDGGAWKQGWDVKPVVTASNGNGGTMAPLQIFVMPHSHCDPGWIKTFDEYFQEQTKKIISTVITALSQDKRRKFIWAEISYFAWWYEDQTNTTRQLVRDLLDRRQLEFVTGGWVQPDEANSELYAMEIQLQEGHDWIRTQLGEQYIPQYGWSIDPFGYSPTMAYLLHQYNFKAMLIQRVHYAVKKALALRKHLEFYWRQTWDEDNKYDMFTHVMPFFSYDVPHTCGPDPAVCCQFDFKRVRGQCPWRVDPQPITETNVAERARLLLDQYKKKAALYRSSAVLIPLGDDFRYQSIWEAEAQYTNYQKLFDYINANEPGVTVQFGTLSEYFNAVHKTWDGSPVPVLKGSFFTYSDVNQDYWSGYYTSRAFDKALDRQLERALFAAEQMGGTRLDLQEPRRALSLFQHHDGVTGTARDHVVQDYALRMYRAIHFTQSWMVQHLQKHPTTSTTVAQWEKAVTKENINQNLTSTEKGNWTLQACHVTFEPRGLALNRCGDDHTVVVYNPLTTPQSCGNTIVPAHTVTLATLPCEIAGPVPHSRTNFVFDPQTGLMQEPVREEWKIWKVSRGGAYLFFPGQLISYDMPKHNVVIEDGGYIVSTSHWKRTVIERQVPTEFGTMATVIDFLYETDLTEDNQEWFVRFTSHIVNNGYFHTDLNGFNIDTHRFRSDMPIQSQVFPMPTLAAIEDSKLRMTVLSEHAQGTASLQDGSIDVWLDRRLSQDDNRGLGQGVQDNRPIQTRFRVVLEREGFSSSSAATPSGEYQVTPLGKRMWEELQHPLELFGRHISSSSSTTITGGGVGHIEDGQGIIADPAQWKEDVKARAEAREGRRRAMMLEEEQRRPPGDTNNNNDNASAEEGARMSPFRSLFGASGFRNWLGPGRKDPDPVPRVSKSPPLKSGGAVVNRYSIGNLRDITVTKFTMQDTVVPFVFMVFKRVEYLKKAVDSLRKSDFPKGTVPLIISHDGAVPDMVEYVETLKQEFKIIQLFHPYSCYEHPDTFPGDDKRLNEGYAGDSYGNPRSPWATCCKHHFTWLLRTVFALDFGSLQVDHFLFLEEDYIVAPTVYSTIVSGLNAMEHLAPETNGGFLGIGLDPTEAGAVVQPYWVDSSAFFAAVFHSGPMTLSRSVFAQLQQYAEEYCRFDDYNWDWSMVHVQGLGHIPHTLLIPSRSQAKHIGIKEGMHVDRFKKGLSRFGHRFQENFEQLDTVFQGNKFYGKLIVKLKEHNRGYGGWGHPADQDHCIKLLTSPGLRPS